jgi:DNA-binding Xre family transcriptional regulator
MLPSDSGGITVRSNMKQLVLLKEVERGDRIQQTEIAEATGLDANTISRWMSPKPLNRIDSSVIVKLCQYFNCGIGDLLYLDFDSKP